jgi:phosphoribosylaminoimidazole-succinocarboxamide synthase
VAYGRRIYDGLPKGSYHPRLHYSGVRVHRRRVTGREFIWRRYSAGSFQKGYNEGWKDFGGRDPYGYDFDPAPRLMQRFPEPLFTPTRKSKNDEPLSNAKVAYDNPEETFLTEKIFRIGEQHLLPRGITLIDKKSEAAEDMLVDEWLTGDCCRFTRTEHVQEGVEPPWLDKELVRQDAIRQWAGGPKVPLTFSDELIRNTMKAYHDMFEAITGSTLSQFQKEYLD